MSTKEELIKFVQWLKEYRSWVIDSSFLLQTKESFNKRIEEYTDNYLSGKWREEAWIKIGRTHKLEQKEGTCRQKRK